MRFSSRTFDVISDDELSKKEVHEVDLVGLLKNPEEESADIVEEVDEEKDDKREIGSNNSNRNEWILMTVLSFVLSALSLLVILFGIDKSNVLSFGEYGFYLDILTWGSVVFIGVTAISQFCFFLFNPSGETPRFKKFSSLIFYIILILCGIAGFDLIVCLLYQENYGGLPLWISLWIGGFVAIVYDYFILKLFAYDKLSDKNIFWEIVRFALVGVIAAVFDFSTTYGTRMLLGGMKISDTIETVIAVTMGFIVGVIVNYLCSVHMVYKASKKSNAKTWHGVIFFVLLSAVGLGIGIGLEALFYDVLKWTYVLVFIIRTLVVMVWNYLTRKLFIFK